MTSTAHPLPALPIVAEHRYLLRFDVQAPAWLAAVEAAGAMLRRDVHLIGVHEVTRYPDTDTWRVVLKVWEEA